MILDRLLDLRDRLDADDDIEVVPEAHKRQTVRWVLPVSRDGRLAKPTETGAKKKDWKEFVAPFVKRTSATRSLLLVDKPDYVLGLADEEKNEARAAERHEAYLALLAEAAEATDDPDLAVLLQALRDGEQVEAARAALAEETWKPGDLIVPRVGEAYPHRRRSVQQFWVERQDAKAADKSSFTASCLACGQEKPIARTHPVPLVLGGNTVGLVTGNAAAFLSHGLKQSEIAPLCGDCARGHGEALRFLLQSDEHHLYVGGGVTWLFWTREPVADVPFGTLLSDPKPEQVRRLLRSPFSGQQPSDAPNTFYALVVSANKSRLVVRDWLTLPVAEAEANLKRYFERQRIQNYEGESPPLKLFALAGATVRDLKDLPPQTVDALVAHALTGRPLPLDLLHQALRRAHAEKEHPVTRPRAALIRLVLQSLLDRQPNRTDLMTDDVLDSNHPEPAYHCGRMLAILDDIQSEAMNANATIVDRFYGAASTTPALVFATLVRKSQPHLSKIRGKKGRAWLADYFERRLGEAARSIPPTPGFPKTLTPEQQGLFALGYYQEKYRPRPKKNQTNSDNAESGTDSSDA